MTKLNKLGAALGALAQVTALTDVTGFGLLGHLKEMCEGSNVCAEIDFKNIPVLPDLDFYIEKKSLPGGTVRNWKSYGDAIGEISDDQKAILADPQTSGGLLIALDKSAVSAFEKMLIKNGLEKFITPIGRILPPGKGKLIEVI